MKLICSFHLHELIFVLEFFKFSGPLWQRIIITCVSIPKWIRVGEFVYPFFDAAAEENLQWIIFHFLSWNRFSEKPKWLVLLWWENTFDTLKRYIYTYTHLRFIQKISFIETRPSSGRPHFSYSFQKFLKIVWGLLFWDFFY